MTTTINIGDKVKCIRKKKIPVDPENFSRRLIIDKVYIVKSFSGGNYNVPVIKVRGSIMWHLQSNFRLVKYRRKP